MLLIDRQRTHETVIEYRSRFYHTSSDGYLYCTYIDTDDLQLKAEYLMQNLKYQLVQDITPAQKLDIFSSLKEAAALEILESYAQDLDFSNYPLTPAVLNTLCLVIGNLGRVKSLSFNNCDIDDELLSVLASETKRQFIKIGKLDIRKNTSWSNVDSWLEVFENMEITTILMDILRDGQKCEDVVFKLLKSTERTVSQVEIGSLECLRISIKEFEEIAKSNIRLTKIKQLWISSDEATFVKELWRATFQRVSCSVDHCFVQLPRVEQTNIIHLKSWTDVVETAKIDTVKEVSVHSDQPISLLSNEIEEIETMIRLNFCGTISNLWVKVQLDPFDPVSWQESFQNMKCTVSRCIVVPEIPERGEIDVEKWIEASKLAEVRSIEKVILSSVYSIALRIGDIRLLNAIQYRETMSNLRMKVQLDSFDPVSWRETFRDMKCTVTRCIVAPEIPECGKIDVKKWIEAAKIAKVGSIEEVVLSSVDGIEVGIEDIRLLNAAQYREKMFNLRVKVNFDSFKLKSWQETFQNISFTVSRCIVVPEIPKMSTAISRSAVVHYIPKYGKVDVAKWIKAAKVAEVNAIEEVTLSSVDRIALRIEDIRLLNEMKYREQILELWMEAPFDSFNVELWEETFQNLTFLIGHCFVSPEISDNGQININNWITAAKIADKESREKVTLRSFNRIPLKIQDFPRLDAIKYRVMVEGLHFDGYQFFTPKMWMDVGASIRNFNVSTISFIHDFESVPNLVALQQGHAALAVRRFTIAPYLPKPWYKMELSIHYPNNDTNMTQAANQNRTNSLDVEIDCLSREGFAESLGRFIASSSFEELVFMNLNSLSFDAVKSLGKGLHQYQIKQLAVATCSNKAIMNLLSSIQAKNTYVEKCDEIHFRRNIRRALQINILSKEEWHMRFTDVK